jgi:hypothetical protein
MPTGPVGLTTPQSDVKAPDKGNVALRPGLRACSQEPASTTRGITTAHPKWTSIGPVPWIMSTYPGARTLVSFPSHCQGGI